mmetsp:Transcript_30163/g.100793  ORF Transcript_30163/g.100793 Transcript_30163/m.100793 type:complete len:374 (-) Transcript_30163:170-1291(-)
MSTRWLARRRTVAPPTKRPCRSAPSLAVRHTERQAAAPSQPAPAPQSSSSPPKPTVCHAGLPPPEKTPPKTTPYPTIARTELRFAAASRRLGMPRSAPSPRACRSSKSGVVTAGLTSASRKPSRSDQPLDRNGRAHREATATVQASAKQGTAARVATKRGLERSTPKSRPRPARSMMVDSAAAFATPATRRKSSSEVSSAPSMLTSAQQAHNDPQRPGTPRPAAASTAAAPTRELDRTARSEKSGPPGSPTGLAEQPWDRLQPAKPTERTMSALASSRCSTPKVASARWRALRARDRVSDTSSRDRCCSSSDIEPRRRGGEGSLSSSDADSTYASTDPATGVATAGNAAATVLVSVRCARRSVALEGAAERLP